uniref:Bardet-Biedl syndrome 2 protein homolog n=1 Tax=Timema monikensis TaxID=170555 RepID=A0A7R9HI83_9NEOP|nr:unnamed protein product [Timema monikensis]
MIHLEVVIHSPHLHNGLLGRVGLGSTQCTQELSTLNMTQSVTALCAGVLDPSTDKDLLVVGTATSLLAYNVDTNMELFYREVPDGVGAMVIGKLGSDTTPLALVGGNCSLQGFDCKGKDVFWSVTGDNVCSLTLLDFDQDGENELIVGSEDFDIRVFKEDHIISEQTETEAVTSLAAFNNSKFGYGLANGTVGVYDKFQRLWRVKSKNRAMSIYAYDLDGDGVEELITGWSNGKIDARSSRTGEVMFKDNLNHAVAGITEGDYRMLGRSDLICCSVEGEGMRKGYNMSGEVGIRTSGVGPGTLSVEQDNFREILSKKQTLLLELRNYQGSAQFSNPAQGHTQDKQIISQEAKTRLQTGISINMGKDHIPPHVEITLSTNNDMIIRAVLVFAEGIFKGETHVIHPKDSEVSSKLNVALFPQKDVPIDIHIKSLVGCKGSQHYHVFELTRQLPRFSMYTLTTESSQPCDSFVSCFINERLQRIAMWLNQNFLLSEDLEVSFELKVSFLSLRNNSELTVTMFPDGRLVINTEDIVLAGELIQSLAAFLNLEHVQVVAEFPLQYRRLEELMQKVIALKEARLRLGAEMADHSGLIRSLVVRAEDARMMDNITKMRKWYSKLSEVNADLNHGYNIRFNNHTELVDALKEVNTIIQKAANLRGIHYVIIVIFGKI